MKKLKQSFLIVSISAFLYACNDSNSDTQTVLPSPIKFEPVEATISNLHESITTQGTDCVSVVKSYLDRINAYDRPLGLNSIISTNPDAMREAAKLDQQYKQSGKLAGPLHCVTVIVKDNIDVVGMPNTAGSSALKNNFPFNDAYIIQNIKKHGGIILGKANLDEFAFTYGGASTVGGQAKNVYDLTKGPGGSSSGTGAAVSASLAMVGIGTDTGGSIRVPASVQGLVGLRPSLRLLSIDGIIPLAPTQDTAGPLCRKVEDCAKLMDAMVGFDSESNESNQRSDFRFDAPLIQSANEYQALAKVPQSYVSSEFSLVGKRIGVLRGFFPNIITTEGRLVVEAHNEAIEKLKAAGAIVEDVSIPNESEVIGDAKFTTTLSDSTIYTNNFKSLSGFEFKKSLTDYLKTANSIYKSYEDLKQSGLMISNFSSSNYDRDVESLAYKQEYEFNTLIRSSYVRERLSATFANKTLTGVALGEEYDVLVYPSIKSLAGAKVSSPSNSGTNNRLSPFSGYPALSMPAKAVETSLSNYPMNVNIEFIAKEFDETTLFNIAAAFEKINPARVTPVHTPAL